MSDVTRSKTPFSGHKHVPYVNDSVPAVARAHLPGKWDDRLTQDRINAFTCAANEDPEIRFVVLGVLRAHTVNGSELPTALLAILTTAIGTVSATYAGANPDFAWLAWLIGVGSLLVTGSMFTLIGAAHVRKQLATVWLGAYIDGLEDVRRAEERQARAHPPHRGMHWIWRRRVKSRIRLADRGASPLARPARR